MAEALGHDRVLGVYAHPDDADVGAGATIHRLVREGAQVCLLVVTSGDAGGYEAEGQENMSQVQTTDLEAKVAAVRRHVSQFRDLDAMEGYLREAALAAGTQAARPGRGHQEADQPVLAESFFRWVLH